MRRRVVARKRKMRWGKVCWEGRGDVLMGKRGSTGLCAWGLGGGEGGEAEKEVGHSSSLRRVRSLEFGSCGCRGRGRGFGELR